MYKTCTLIICLSMTLFSGCGGQKEEDKSTTTTGEINQKEQSKPTPAVKTKWEVAVTKSDLAIVVNFLINNKGKEIELSGEKYVITGKEKLDVEITVLLCCDEKMLRRYISTFGIVKDVKFPTFYSTVPANAIPEIDKYGEVEEIKFDPEERDFWMRVIQK